LEHQSIALATLGCDGLNDGEQPNSAEPKVGTGTDA
jgi:hypothetical protein